MPSEPLSIVSTCFCPGRLRVQASWLDSVSNACDCRLLQWQLTWLVTWLARRALSSSMDPMSWWKVDKKPLPSSRYFSYKYTQATSIKPRPAHVLPHAQSVRSVSRLQGGTCGRSQTWRHIPLCFLSDVNAVKINVLSTQNFFFPETFSKLVWLVDVKLLPHNPVLSPNVGGSKCKNQTDEIK